MKCSTREEAGFTSETLTANREAELKGRRPDTSLGAFFVRFMDPDFLVMLLTCSGWLLQCIRMDFLAPTHTHSPAPPSRNRVTASASQHAGTYGGQQGCQAQGQTHRPPTSP